MFSFQIPTVNIFYNLCFSSVECIESDQDIMSDSVLDESQMQTSTTKSALSSSTTKDNSISSNSEHQRPKRVKDFTVLANLVELATNCIPKCDKIW